MDMIYGHQGIQGIIDAASYHKPDILALFNGEQTYSAGGFDSWRYIDPAQIAALVVNGDERKIEPDAKVSG
jgi:hypothetical protein